jgi:hypothetical protein
MRIVLPSPPAPLPRAGEGRSSTRVRAGFGPPLNEGGCCPCHYETGAASRSTLVTAPPAQPVEANCHCETGAAGRINLITAQPVEARGHCEPPQAAKQTVTAPPAQPVEAIPFAPQPNGALAPPAQPVEAHSHCEPPQAAKQSPSPPAPLPRTGAGRSAPRTGPSPAGRAGVRSSVRPTLKPLVGRGIFSPLLSLGQSPGCIPIPCEHPVLSPRAARGVVRDPLRFLAALGMTSRCARNDQHAASSIVIGIAPLASRLSPLPSPLSPLPSRLTPRPSLPSHLSPRASPLSPLIPIPCEHPVLSPRAARGVVRDPLRFLAALGMTSRCARNDQHAASSIVIGIAPLASRLSPLASRLSPLPSRLAPLAPRTSRLSPLASLISHTNDR